MSARKIVVLATGGTIAGTAASAGDNVGYSAAQIGIEQLLARIPALQGLPVLAEQVAQIDSKDMDWDVWRALAQRCAHWLAQDSVQGIVITHGTDTLEETAYFLQQVLAPAKPVVLTCAMRPATALLADGPQNIVDALAVAAWPGAQGVVAVCAGVVHAADDVAKVHPYRLDAFGSGDAGPLGHVEEGRLRLLRNWPVAPVNTAPSAIENIAKAQQLPRVEIVLNHAGASGAMVRDLVAGGVRGIVVAGTGNGTLHQGLEAALLAAQAGGVALLLASRCANGSIVRHAAGPIRMHARSAVKARIDLQLELLA
ncbi:asparaginase [uncultured Ramlibacter sp.]|uniref:asparaginase n=1 Tax=uncultured Ramlibacter sp. TaxID=260755 RepID=UPI00261C2464|nr:asparaginase [uncultured Ramlibacter sp.]